MPEVFEIDQGGHCMYFAPSTSIGFSLVSRNGRLVRVVSACRDYINDCVIAYLNQHKSISKSGSGIGWCKERNATIDFNSLRLLISKGVSVGVTNEIIEARIFDAKRIINMYEELAGFSRRSKIKRVKLKGYGCWLLIGPSQWMKSTHLISMVTLIFRVVSCHGGFNDCESLDHVEERFSKLCGSCKDGTIKWTIGSDDLIRLLPASWPKFRMFMELYPRMFGSKTKKFWNPEEGVGQWHGPGGIFSLSTKKMPNKSIKCHLHKMDEIYQKGKSA